MADGQAGLLRPTERLPRAATLSAVRGTVQADILKEDQVRNTCIFSTELPCGSWATFLDPAGSPTIIPPDVIRATQEEEDYAIAARDAFQERNAATAPAALTAIQQAALDGENIFAALMEACKVCTLGQISAALYQVGGQYRRNM